MERLFQMRNKMVRRAALDFASTHFKNRTIDLANTFTDEAINMLKSYSKIKQDNKDFKLLQDRTV